MNYPGIGRSPGTLAGPINRCFYRPHTVRRLGLRSHRIMAVCTCWSLSGHSMRFLFRPRTITVLIRELIAFRAASSAVPSLRHIPLYLNFIYNFPFFLYLNHNCEPFIYQNAHNCLPDTPLPGILGDLFHRARQSLAAGLSGENSQIQE